MKTIREKEDIEIDKRIRRDSSLSFIIELLSHSLTRMFALNTAHNTHDTIKKHRKLLLITANLYKT